jgi:hypothetical protein
MRRKRMKSGNWQNTKERETKKWIFQRKKR